MATIVAQRDLVVNFKKETILNVGLLSKLHPMPSDLYRQIFNENALEKPTQNLFNHLSYYLVSIIDNQVSNSLPWPLYDTKTERTYRNELSVFISDYSSKGLLSPVMSSYLVNPGCYKVTMLIFQLSYLATQKVLLSKMKKDSQKRLYNDMTEKYKSQDKDFIDQIEKETVTMTSKFSYFLCKREVMEKIAELFRNRITEMEGKLTSLKAQEYINSLVDDFLKTNNVDDKTKAEIENIKNVNKSSEFFEAWLEDTDNKITAMETEWDNRVTPLLKLCQETQNNSEMLIARQTGETERSLFTLEYNPKTDNLCTKDLQGQVNTEQKYILKNVIKDDRLNFPNLVRAFLISICFILKNTEIGDEIYKFNEYLDGGRRNLTEIVSSMRLLLNRVMNAEARLQPSQPSYSQSLSLKEVVDIPPLPDLSEIKMGKDLQSQIIFDTFTPLNVSKHQLNLRRRANGSFARPQPRSLLIAPFYQGPRDDFAKSLISCRISSYDRPNATQNFNLSILSQTNLRNETIAECSSGFTKQQILRLLSTKKSSSSKKFKYKTERPNITVKKGGLFNESQASTDSSNGLIRSHSSPNLFEHREKKSKIPVPRKLSVMQEDCPLLEVSGISALDKDNSYGTPEGVLPLQSSRKLFDASSLPVISITPEPEKCTEKENFNNVFADVNLPKLQENIIENEERKTETPKTNTNLIRKTSSIEKIINKFKKVRARATLLTNDESEFKTIEEHKENFDMLNVEVFSANRILLPDLLSPNCSVLPKMSMDNFEDLDDVPCRKPRESLGTALGVDHTFLDQFDLLD
ncbi:unnamed protein product [Chrysodeixis includens]|uniref:HAUS augmin-like complex subunit 6 N-terminal domain-containing protein n=1 Tax=Chrysodeixis includens TaxID=689277 RepID=A0A9N8Q250_CHRIL|nr:unnamed protein product [Chrysodeixis includens]